MTLKKNTNNHDEFIVDIIPYKNGRCFLDDISSWLKNNVRKEEYSIVDHPTYKKYSSRVFPTRYIFNNKEDALAFKLRW